MEESVTQWRGRPQRGKHREKRQPRDRKGKRFELKHSELWEILCAESSGKLFCAILCLSSCPTLFLIVTFFSMVFSRGANLFHFGFFRLLIIPRLVGLVWKEKHRKLQENCENKVTFSKRKLSDFVDIFCTLIKHNGSHEVESSVLHHCNPTASADVFLHHHCHRLFSGTLFP